MIPMGYIGKPEEIAKSSNLACFIRGELRNGNYAICRWWNDVISIVSSWRGNKGRRDKTLRPFTKNSGQLF